MIYMKVKNLRKRRINQEMVSKKVKRKNHPKRLK